MDAKTVKQKLVLASQSLRRKELLKLITDDFICDYSDLEEVLDCNNINQDIMRLAYEKAHQMVLKYPDCVIIGADTVVVINQKILGKPVDLIDARKMLEMLSGKTHHVITGVSLVKNEKTFSFYEKSEVTFYDLSDQDIAAYLKTKECLGKAGSYAIQGKGALFVKAIKGDYYNIVGLPVAKLSRALKAFE